MGARLFLFRLQIDIPHHAGVVHLAVALAVGAINLRNCPMGKETAPITVVAFRAESYSPDGKNLIISLRTKYSSAERKYIVPLECLKDLLVDLQRLQASGLNTQPRVSIRM